MTRVADLLQQGAIMKQKFQPYEAHLQYLLQFMVDYNLYGCNYLDASRINFRAPVPLRDEGSNSIHLWHSLSIPLEHVTDDLSLPRVSHCSIEVDISVQDIANRMQVKERSLHHDFVERLAPLSADEKLVHSMAGLWSDETKRRRKKMGDTKSGSSPFPPEVLVSMSANPRDTEPQGWLHEDEYQQNLARLVAQEIADNSELSLKFDDFASCATSTRTINTALQSVEDLYPTTLTASLGFPEKFSHNAEDYQIHVEVDDQKAMLVSQEDKDSYVDDSDEEALGGAPEAASTGVPTIRITEPVVLKAINPHLPKPFKTLLEKRNLLSIPGVCASRLKTTKPPIVSVYPELIGVAVGEGWVSKLRGYYKRPRPIASRGKRAGSTPLALPSMKKLARRAARSIITARIAPIVAASGLKSRHKSSKWRNTMKIKSQPLRSKVLPLQSPQQMEHSSDPRPQRTRLNFRVVKATTSVISKWARPLSTQQPSSRNGRSSLTKHVSFAQRPSTTGEKRTHASLKLNSLRQDSYIVAKDSRLMRLAQRWRSSTFQGKALLYHSFAPATQNIFLKAHCELPDTIYQDAFYGNERDVPLAIREYAGREYRLESNTLPFLPDFDILGTSPQLHGARDERLGQLAGLNLDLMEQSRMSYWKSWEIAVPSPGYREVETWGNYDKTARPTTAEAPKLKPSATAKLRSQIQGPTEGNKHGFKYTQTKKSTSVQHEAQYMSTMSLEIHVNSRGKLVPNPEEDEVQCIFWAARSDEAALITQNPAENEIAGVILQSIDDDFTRRVQKMALGEVIEENSELNLIVRMIEIVRTHDPDILTGYEVHGSSWGYLIERARVKYDYNLCDQFSRMKTESHGRFGKENDRWGFNTTSTIRVTGRHMINIWRAMRGELNLLQYTMENVAWHILHRRIPHYDWRTLTEWYASGKQHDLKRLLRYYQIRTRLDIEILEANELIPRTSEQARLLGVDFFSVFSRGSQFKVESIMFRIAKPENLILVSPSRKQVGGQNALECLPLVMEPQSAFYSSPLLVLDFQSLYPSVMIAYNLCYSTFLGRITNWRGMNKMGFTEYKRQRGMLALLKDYINIAPNGMMYVRSEIRKSLLAKMLTEILETRVMVKSGMKQDKDDKTLQQLLNNRQLALKLLANVTYGYTSASFSGRMPCSEIADSIVQTGRETLERAIAYIHSIGRWNAEVVYGDTDSLFVYLKGRSKDEAFEIGNEIAAAITAMNPSPVKLKFEKVYLPCVLLAKKRYVGYKYETKDQLQPDFDAKGIETVRRDGTPAEQKIEEKALKILFETADLSRIKSFFQEQCEKIMRGSVSVQDFCFAKEVRLGSYSDKGPPPAGALISTKKMLEDARAEPQYGERVPYVVVTGAPGARLIDRCVAPEDLLTNPHWQLDAEYYISKNLVPPLERIFNLVGANVRSWYDEMPKVQRVHHSTILSNRKTTLESYMKSTNCLVCNAKFTNEGDQYLCGHCRCDIPMSLAKLQAKVAKVQRRFEEVLTVCRTCAGLSPLDEVRCVSKDCPVFWTRVRQKGQMKSEVMMTEPAVRELLQGVNNLTLEW